MGVSFGREAGVSMPDQLGERGKCRRVNGGAEAPTGARLTVGVER